MLLIPIQTPLLRSGDDLATILQKHGAIQAGDIVVISSKAVATTEGAAIDLSKMKATEEAEEWNKKTGRSPEFCETVLNELKRLHGKAVGHCPGAILTEVKPEGLAVGTILTANAGLDESNVEKGKAIGWPRDPMTSAKKLRDALGGKIGILITDSCCRPRRLGVTAFALVTAGVDPLVSLKGREDLYGEKMRITTEAVADQLATAANMLMGNEAQAVPAVIVRDHGIELSDVAGWVPGIEPAEDLFRGIL
ncbi:coenzyme F420-0:L-glutamate ligase [Candidatus Peregrinibacteria bacterium]|nr:coenzyme F420-0:L-glutamate ligase [Candidatus Peregrinibacteria bacterium]